jgi:hypothetical protein
MIIRAAAGRLGEVKRAKGKGTHFKYLLEENLYSGHLPPKTEQIRSITNRQNWTVDLKPIAPMNWQSGRSLATRLEAIERAKGQCERCNENPLSMYITLYR